MALAHGALRFCSLGRESGGVFPDIIKSDSITNKRTLKAEDKKELEAAALILIDVVKRRKDKEFDAAAERAIDVIRKIVACNPEAVREDGTLSWNYINFLDNRDFGSGDLPSNWSAQILFYPPKGRHSITAVEFLCSKKEGIDVSAPLVYEQDPAHPEKIFVHVAEFLLNYSSEKPSVIDDSRMPAWWIAKYAPKKQS